MSFFGDLNLLEHIDIFICMSLLLSALYLHCFYAYFILTVCALLFIYLCISGNT
jgi:hypothetical protein